MPSTSRSLSPALITRETLAGVLTALALIPEVISFSVIAGVDPQVSLIASVVLCLAMSVLGGRPAMVTAAAGSVALVIGPMVHQHGVGYILPAVILAGIIQILFGICGMARLMRFIPPPVMTGFVNALGILIFFAQVPHFWSRQPLIVGLFVLTLLIVLWAPRFIKAVPAPLIAIVLLTAYTVTSGQLLPTVGDEGAMGGGLPGFNALAVPLDLNTLKIIWPCALSIAFVGLMESLLTAKLVDDLTHTPSNKSRESAGLGIANILAGCYGGIAGCAMIGQTIVNVEMGKARSRLSTIVAGMVLLLLVTVLSQVMAKIPMPVLAGVMVIVAVKTFSWQSIRPTALARNPWPETVVMAATVVVTVTTSNLAIGVLAGLIAMALIPRRLRVKAQLTSETASPDQGK
ncbi:TPA: SulP family inorganic anion transporter [Klebsiella aerogenes]|jgi:SulP family sulfate permease|uniref:SulP family inorganic anion transporter n=1 Tax=Klebsiella TaxID=570 RepID=UPI0006518A8F|nr:SulP family inorganic anion transporter [Klebsiella aerogenes]EIV2482805.1 SulP family inorganic anion transporter [Klebsiella aerogenes]EJL5447781.1 SulP family inorganic anion transporter [Klebsiella aerogenes]EKY1835259.1 SulP family inorganic anion transporter [Klebsiella aerogenes]EKZ3166328.1 SulP family inorganic anion transporter [Klebsiella aerogenes]EKZ6402783.1 SulP family inorganic anion transporter [Klebsiella aerogenes]